MVRLSRRLSLWGLCGLVALAVAPMAAPVARAEGLPNLSDEKPAARFTLTPPVWPANVGDAAVCVWKDDKVSAVSFTVDDNTAPDVPWWLEMGDKYGLRITWFVISKNVGMANGFGGTWDMWKNVLAKGHDIQSHSHTHLKTDLPEWKDINWEYEESQKMLEANLPGHKVRFLAYPGGKNSERNDRGVAGKYYAGARGATGTLVPVNAVDYMNVRAVTESSFDNPKAQWADIKRVLDPKDKVYRAWAVLIYHSVNDKQVTDRPMFKFIADHKDEFWMAFFAEASAYGQERDTATLAVTDKSDAKITFTLTDKMDDARFDYPLTIKLRVPDAWKDAAADQAGKPAEAKFVEHDGKKYVLVQAVPDRGAVTVTGKR
jgi:peptidoglycan/xylan/chitin deacetylase (PgdA/CDA1 family)